MLRSPAALAGALTLVCFGLASPEARALSSTASLDWSRLAVKVIDTDLTDGVDANYSFSDFFSMAGECLEGEPACPNAWGIAASDWGSSQSTTAHLAGMSGTSGFDTKGIFASAQGLSPSGLRNMHAARGVNLMLTGSAQVEISVPFLIATDAAGGDSEHGSFAFASLDVYDFGTGGLLRDQRFISSPWDGTVSRSGMLSVTLNHFGAGAGYRLSGLAFARLDHDPVLPPVSAVPEPATYGLMGAGLLLVAAARRRRR